MPAFYLTFIAVLLAGFGGRDQATVAGLSHAQGRRPAVLVVAVLAGLLTAALAAWAARWMLVQLPPPARAIFAAAALGLAGLESLVFAGSFARSAARRTPREPTNSLGALALVLVAGQVTDAARFIVFGMAVGLAAPAVSGAAGMLAAALLLAFAWLRPDLVAAPAARWTRRIAGLALVLAALAMLLRYFGIS